MIMETDIRKVKTYVISLKNQNDRRENIKKVLHDLNFKNWEFFDAIDVRNKFPYWIGCGLSHFSLLENATYPCIVLEDDVSDTSWFYPFYNFSEDSITYLGLSSWGLKNGISEHTGCELKKIDESFCQVKYMTGAHAIYYPSKDIARKYYKNIINCLFENLRPFDELYAKIQKEIKTYGLNKPCFYQKCVHNEKYTNFFVS
jgi:GR25 family glycosyltransferase involved in LPS biosynthesis